MITTTAKEYGIEVKIAGRITMDDIIPEKHLETALENLGGRRFCVCLNLVDLIWIDEEAWVRIAEGRKVFRAHGMVRSAVLLPNRATLERFRFVETPPDALEYERLFVEDRGGAVLVDAMRWLVDGVDPLDQPSVVDLVTEAE